MSLKKKLIKWQNAKIISTDQAEKIATLEKNNKSAYFIKGLYGLAIFTILSGVSAIIGANWQDIPPSVKLLVHIAINSGAAYAVYHFAKTPKLFVKEICVFVFMGLSLTLIALVGQVFQLDGTIGGALLLWMLLITPFVMTYGRTRLSLLPWIFGFVVTLNEAMELFWNNPYFRDDAFFAFTLAINTLCAFIFLIVSTVLNRKNAMPVLSDLLHSVAMIGLVIMTSIACQLWYDDRDINVASILPYIIVGFLLSFMLSILDRIDSKTKIVKSVIYLPPVSLLFIALPYLMPSLEADIIAALLFIVYWIFVGLMAVFAEKQGYITLSIAVVAFRVYIVFLELFGSLLMTGFGLIFAGLALIGVIWMIRKLNAFVGQIDLNTVDS